MLCVAGLPKALLLAQRRTMQRERGVAHNAHANVRWDVERPRRLLLGRQDFGARDRVLDEVAWRKSANDAVADERQIVVLMSRQVTKRNGWLTLLKS